MHTNEQHREIYRNEFDMRLDGVSMQCYTTIVVLTSLKDCGSIPIRVKLLLSFGKEYCRWI